MSDKVVAYLCGAVSHGGTASEDQIADNIDTFKRIEAKLNKTTTRIHNPTNLPPQETWEDYMKLTIPMLCEADFLILLPGWEASRGAIFEVLIANTLNIPIVFSDHLLDRVH